MVDEPRVWPHARGVFRGKPACHLTVNGTSESHVAALHALALRIGCKRSWFQPRSTAHYDLVESMRARAIDAGAVFVPAKEQARARIEARRGGALDRGLSLLLAEADRPYVADTFLVSETMMQELKRLVKQTRGE